MKTIGIVTAMENEAADIRACMQDVVKERISGADFYAGTIGSTRVVLSTSGMGKVSMAVCAQTMILRYGPELMINTGIAGSLAEDIHIGDLVVATDVVEHDMDVSPLKLPPGWLVGPDIVKLPADPQWSETFASFLRAKGCRVFTGTVATGDQFIATDRQRERILRDFPDALCAEMEGGALGHVCFQNGVPFCVIRTISDNAGDDSESDYETFAEETAARNAEMVVRLVGEL